MRLLLIAFLGLFIGAFGAHALSTFSHHDRHGHHGGAWNIDSVVKTDFTLPALLADDTETEVSIVDPDADFTVLFFYPEDRTFVCPTELREMSVYRDEFEDRNVTIYPVSVDSLESHRDWRDDLVTEDGDPFEFTWLSDTDGRLAHKFGIRNESNGRSDRASIILDSEGKVVTMLIHNDKIGRSASELVRILDAASTDELCPASYQDGDETLGTPEEAAARAELEESTESEAAAEESDATPETSDESLEEFSEPETPEEDAELAPEAEDEGSDETSEESANN